MMTDSVAPSSKPSVRPMTDVDLEKVLRLERLRGSCCRSLLLLAWSQFLMSAR